ncbi:BnaA05g13250D [Brassica napus]|uniref:BnaA05g13250D protein n=1 Tax=Brassica napus TaxID=3708 RepID=A0A078F5G6_BRANA|nr:BnaA05g13250D [Brassica napus]
MHQPFTLLQPFILLGKDEVESTYFDWPSFEDEVWQCYYFDIKESLEDVAFEEPSNDSYQVLWSPRLVIHPNTIAYPEEIQRSKKKNKPFSATNRTADRAAEGADQFDGAQSVGARNNQGEILETNRESPAKERQKKKRSVEKRQNKFSENGLREPVGMDKMIKSKSWSSLRRLRAPMTPLFIYIFVRYKK